MKIAVVGSGVSGLAATWLLNEHSDHEVHLFEVNDRAGGHANTVTCQVGGTDVHVDAGFVVFDPTASPNFIRFLKRYPDITVLPTRVTSGVSGDHGVFEWAANILAGVLSCRPSRLFDPCMWRLLYDILRFNACARRLVINEDNHFEDCSVAEYLAREGYSDTFRDDYLIPTIAALWSTPHDKCILQIPAQTLVRFMSNHHLLQIMGKPTWSTIKGGSHRFVNSILQKLAESQLHLSTPITSVGSAPDGTMVQITTAGGRSLNFDRVIMACHSNTALTLLRAGCNATEEEKRVLGRFTWNRNETVLHRDVNLMRKSRSAWSCWNSLTFSAAGREGAHKATVMSVTCMDFLLPRAKELNMSAPTDDMNLLLSLPASKYGPLFVTLNPPVEPATGTVVSQFEYDHPVLNKQALVSMREMHKIQGHRGILYVGAWLGYGLYEDGFTSGLRVVAHHIEGVRMPFEIASSNTPVHAVFVAHLFDSFEWSGARHMLGVILSFVLAVLGRLLRWATWGIEIGRGRQL